MKKVKKSWIALLLGALLMATVVGVVWARPKASPAWKVTLPGAHFHPDRDGYDWQNHGNYIRMDGGGTGWFFAALPIALPGRFTVEKLTLFAYDYSTTQDVCASLYRVNPWEPIGTSEVEMASVCSNGSSLTDPRVFSTTSINPDTIYGGHGGYVMITMPYSALLRVEAVQVEYH